MGWRRPRRDRRVPRGKGEIPLGAALLGIDADEFEKCALVRQGDLDQVVPGDERQRRQGSLRARLESAADTHIGDTNATEALKVLEDATRRYNAPELEFTGTIDNAIERLTTKVGLIEADLKALEHDLEAAAGPLDELARLADREQSLKQKLRELEAERHEGLAADLRRQIAENDRNIEELRRLETESNEISAAAALPANAESELRETIARHEEATKNLETLDTRRREEMEKERRSIEAQLHSLKPYADYSEDEANQCVSIGSEMRRLMIDDARLRNDVFTLRDQLAGDGYEPEHIQFLSTRFGALPDTQLRLLRQHGSMSLAFQTEVAQLETERTSATEALRALDAVRNGRRMPGIFLLALGLGAALAGGVSYAMHGAAMVWGGLLAGGGIAAIVGAVVLGSAARAGAAEQADAQEQLEDAQRRMQQLRTSRAEHESSLASLARSMGYRDVIELVAQWNEYERLLEDSGPLTRAQEELVRIEERRKAILEESRPLMRGMADGTPAPEHLEKIAYEVRRTLTAKQRMAELDSSWAWTERERQVAVATVSGLHEKALRILQQAGLAYDPERTWAEHIADLSGRLQNRHRFRMLQDELIPYARSRVLSEDEIDQRRRHLGVFEAGREGAGTFGNVRAPEDVDAESRSTRDELEKAQQRRSDLRVEVEEVWRRANQSRPELEAQRARMSAALARAQRYKKSVELAHATIQKVAVDTHRRWADWLNVRVGELLAAMGSDVRQVRFGDDLDFSVQSGDGPTLPRGKAHLMLSSGARDQLYLAVRLAISEYLSRGHAALPLLIDDAFATSDDERLRQGLTMLVDGLASGHQVIVATCHRGRHDDLRRLDPERFIGQMNWLEVRAASHVRS